jgi:hypothetical protein
MLSSLLLSHWESRLQSKLIPSGCGLSAKAHRHLRASISFPFLNQLHDIGAFPKPIGQTYINSQDPFVSSNGSFAPVVRYELTVRKERKCISVVV